MLFLKQWEDILIGHERGDEETSQGAQDFEHLGGHIVSAEDKLLGKYNHL